MTGNAAPSDDEILFLKAIAITGFFRRSDRAPPAPRILRGKKGTNTGNNYDNNGKRYFFYSYKILMTQYFFVNRAMYYSNRITTISDLLPVRTVGPQSPTPLEV